MTQTTPATTWRYQTIDETAIHLGNPTDARGLRLRRDSGYGWVHMGTHSGWLQIHVAIRKLETAEGIALAMAGAESPCRCPAHARRTT